MYVSAIVLAAGKGLRFSAKASKPLSKINSRPLIVYCLDILSRHRQIDEIIVVSNSRNLKGITDIIRQYRIKKVKKVILGGLRRQDSVYCGLKAVDNDARMVLVHDAARPFIDQKIVSSLLRETKKCGAAIAGVPVKATIKSVARGSWLVARNYIVEKTLNRENLWEVQTPQVFKKDLILKAYAKFGNIEVTDDASLVEKLGHKVRLVKGSYFNIKITTPEDLVLAEAILKNRNR